MGMNYEKQIWILMYTGTQSFEKLWKSSPKLLWLVRSHTQTIHDCLFKLATRGPEYLNKKVENAERQNNSQKDGRGHANHENRGHH